MQQEVFRANVGIAVLDTRRRQVLVFERADVPNAWQLPQGGIDSGEEPISAAYRELAEETGLTKNDVALAAEYPDWLSYELPVEYRTRGFRGQTQRWFIFTLTGSTSQITLTSHQPEFAAWRWLPIDELPRIAAPFRRATYQALSDFIVAP